MDLWGLILIHIVCIGQFLAVESQFIFILSQTILTSVKHRLWWSSADWSLFYAPYCKLWTV